MEVCYKLKVHLEVINFQDMYLKGMQSILLITCSCRKISSLTTDVYFQIPRQWQLYTILCYIGAFSGKLPYILITYCALCTVSLQNDYSLLIQSGMLQKHNQTVKRANATWKNKVVRGSKFQFCRKA